MIRRANVVGVPIGVPVFNSQASGTDAELMRSSQSGYTVGVSQSGGHTLLSRSQSSRLQTRLENRLRMAQSSMVFSSHLLPPHMPSQPPHLPSALPLLASPPPPVPDHQRLLDAALRNAAKREGRSISALIKLLHDGASVNAVDDNGWNALHEAARAGRQDVVELFMEHAGDIAIRTCQGDCPLELATHYHGPFHELPQYLASFALTSSDR